MFKKIVVGVDFTPISERAVGAALDLARATQASVVLVHVIPVGAAVQGATASQPALRPTLEKRLEDYAAELSKGTGLPVGYGVLEGGEAEELVKYVTQWGGDLLVLGTRSRTAVQQLVIGSVAAGVVHHATVPVLLLGPNTRP